MKQRLLFGSVWLVLLLPLLSAAQTSTPKPDLEKLPKLMPREHEIEMALSAAPEHLRKDATVYVLQRGGFVKAKDGTNGFSCLVLRESGGGTAPICYDAEGSQTTLLRDFREAELVEQGKDAKEVAQIIGEEYKAGKLLAPRKPGVAYMLSTEFKQHNHKTGQMELIFPPHVMFYAPYMKNADVGALPNHRGSQTQPWILNEGSPTAYVIVVPKSQTPPKPAATGAASPTGNTPKSDKQ